MPLSESQKTKLDAWIKQKDVGLECPACAARKWVAGHLIEAPTYPPDGTEPTGPTTAMVQLVCGKCFLVLLFAAEPIGLV